MLWHLNCFCRKPCRAISWWADWRPAGKFTGGGDSRDEFAVAGREGPRATTVCAQSKLSRRESKSREQGEKQGTLLSTVLPSVFTRETGRGREM